jgi:hypothetical protein
MSKFGTCTFQIDPINKTMSMNLHEQRSIGEAVTLAHMDLKNAEIVYQSFGKALEAFRKVIGVSNE